MALQTGFNLSASDMKSLLERINKQQSGVRTWRQLFGNASLGYNAQSSALTNDYASAVAEAYKTNQAQRNALLGAGLNVGATKDFLTQSRNDLQTAYDTYIRNYVTDASKLATAYSEEVNTINTALTERATNFANLYNSAYKYLSDELYGGHFGNKNYFAEHGLEWAYRKDENGKPTTDLMSWNELAHILFDANGNLTMEGTKFFDQIFNTTTPQGYTRTDKDGNEIALRGFDQWLSDTDSKLRDWAAGADLFNYNRAGTNLGTAKVLTGLESDDMKYHQSEYLTKEDVENVFTPLLKSPIDITNSTAYKDTKGALTELDEAIKVMQDYVDPYGTGYNPHETAVRTADAKYTHAKEGLNEYISTEIQNRVVDLAAFDEQLKTVLGDYYSELMSNPAYLSAINAYKVAEQNFKNARNTVDVMIEDGLKQFEQAESDYRNAYANLISVISSFVQTKRNTKKPSGF